MRSFKFLLSLAVGVMWIWLVMALYGQPAGAIAARAEGGPTKPAVPVPALVLDGTGGWAPNGTPSLNDFALAADGVPPLHIVYMSRHVPDKLPSTWTSEEVHAFLDRFEAGELVVLDVERWSEWSVMEHAFMLARVKLARPDLRYAVWNVMPGAHESLYKALSPYLDVIVGNVYVGPWQAKRYEGLVRAKASGKEVIAVVWLSDQSTKEHLPASWHQVEMQLALAAEFDAIAIWTHPPGNAKRQSDDALRAFGRRAGEVMSD